MSNFTLPVFFILSLAVLTGCSDSSNDQSQSETDAEQPVVVVPIDGSTDPDDESADPVPDKASGSDPEDSEPVGPEVPTTPVQEPPATGELPIDPLPDSGSTDQSDELKGDEISIEEFSEAYSQVGIWRSRMRTSGQTLQEGSPASQYSEAQPDRLLNGTTDLQESYAISDKNGDSVLRTQCRERESDLESLSLVSVEEPLDPEDESDGCRAPVMKYFQISDNSLRAEQHCESGQIFYVKFDRISDQPVFTQGSIVFDANGFPDAVIENDFCGEIQDSRSYWRHADGTALSNLPHPRRHDVGHYAYFRYEDGYLQVFFSFTSDLERVDGVETGKEYPVVSWTLEGSPVAADAVWRYFPDDGSDGWWFLAESGSVRFLEATEHSARVSFNLADEEGKSVVGEMTVNLQ